MDHEQPGRVLEGSPGLDVALTPQLFDAILGFARDGIVILGRNGAIVRWNHMSERILGVTASDAEGRSLPEVVPGSAHQTLSRAADTVMSGSPLAALRLELRRPDGLPIAVCLWGGPIFGVTGAHASFHSFDPSSSGEIFLGEDPSVVAGAVLMVRDETGLHSAQAPLARFEIHTHDTDGLANVGTWLWDIGTDTVQWSEQCYRIHGVDPLTFGDTLTAYLEAVCPQHRAAVARALRDAAADDRPFEIVYRTTAAGGLDGSLVRARGQVLRGSDGAVLGLGGVVQLARAGHIH